VAGVVPL